MYEIWKQYVEIYSNYRVRTKVLTLFGRDLDLLTPKYIGISLATSYIYVWNMKAVSWKLVKFCVRNKVLKNLHCDLDLWPFDAEMYRYLPLTILHLCMKYGSCTLKKKTQVIASETKCWQSSVVILTFNLLIQKCIGIFLLLSCIYVWNMKTVRWKLLKCLVAGPE